MTTISACGCGPSHWLPPLSACLVPTAKIEHWWFVLKNWMRQRWDDFDGSVLDLVFNYNKEQEKEGNRSFLFKHYDCLAPSAMSTLS